MEITGEKKDVTIHDMPNEVLEAVFEFLEKNDLLETALVCNE